MVSNLLNFIYTDVYIHLFYLFCSLFNYRILHSVVSQLY
jgi:hypothetical protein